MGKGQLAVPKKHVRGGISALLSFHAQAIVWNIYKKNDPSTLKIVNRRPNATLSLYEV